MDILTQFSVLVAIWVAIYGIDAWRREHVGKRRIELAEDTLALFYEAADAIRHIRHPASFGYETEQVERGENETEAHFRARKNASVVFHRYNQYQELFSTIHASRYRFMAQIGKAEAQPFDDLRGIVNDITMSARLLARYWPRDHFRTEQQEREHRERIDKQEAIFWEGAADSDPINPRLEQAIVSIEATCRSVIDGKGTLYGLLNRKLFNRNAASS